MVTPGEAPASDRVATLSAYEELRRRVITGAGSGGPFGLIVLVREGVAAWLARRSSGVAAPSTTPASNRPGASPRVGDEVRESMVHVLAAMALARRMERTR